MNKDVAVIRQLAKELLDISNKPVQEERRNLWRRHNSFHGTRPPIYIRAFAFDEILDVKQLKCEDPFFRHYEYYMHMMKFRDTIGDDFIIEPWLTVSAVYNPPVYLRWGVEPHLGKKTLERGAAAYDPCILEEEDIIKVVPAHHAVDEKATSERLQKLQEAAGDIVPIHLERCGSLFVMWNGDISTDMAKLRGLEQIMWDVYDRPEWLHKLMGKMRDGILQAQAEAEQNGDLSLADHQNQAMSYAEELEDPRPGSYGRKRSELWGYMASQETTTFSPEMFDEFMLQYQIPIIEKFGLSAYGCCEDLTRKISCLRKIKNLRRIAVSPFADAKLCSEQIGKDYILSWRPNPSSMISTGLDEDFVRKTMRENFKVFKTNGNYFDITLKDVETINHQPQNVSHWVQIVREEIENCF